MKILFYADPHFRETSSYPPFNRVQENGLTGELNNILLGFDFIRSRIEEYEPNLVIDLGDTYHKDNTVSVRTLHAASLGMGRISSICKMMGIDHLILVGNHDIYAVNESDGSKITSICSLEAHGILVTENMNYSLGKRGKAGFNIFLVPFTDSLEEAYQGILEGSHYDLIAAHIDFLGAVHDNNHPVEVGLDSNVAVPVICGHIHLQQVVGSVIYPGSLIQGRFTREHLEDAGGVLIYDTDSNEYEIIQNDLSKHFIKVKDLNKLKFMDPDRCILKVYSELPEDDVQGMLEGFQYMFITSKNKDEAAQNLIRNEIDKPEKMLRDFIIENKPEYVEIYDGVIK